MAYKMCKRLIQLGRTDGMKDKLDIYLAADRMTTDQYNELMLMLNNEEN